MDIFQMEQKHVCASICDVLPTQSANHPWLIDQNLEDDSRDHIIYTTHDPPFQSRFRIPWLLGRRIRGCFYGWVILSNHPHNDMWSLWNPVTCKIIYLPRLAPKNGFKGINFTECCLSSPPDDYGSVFMLGTINYTIVLCRLDCNRNKWKWVEMSYAKQMRSIVGCDSFLCALTCCNHRVYALSSGYRNKKVIHIDVVVNGRQTVISLMPYLEPPPYNVLIFPVFLKGCCTEFFFIEVSYNEMTRETIGDVRVFKLGVTDIKWDDMEDLKGAAFFVDLAHNYSVFYSTASEVGGCLHFLDTSGKVIHSIYLKNRATTLSLMSAHMYCFYVL
ncbi:hypothetical protein QVD17_19181 [Tagetes erecta]|uniref:KIB1-4 beta-propeller domain-containing protein n=1 Tax=Tagetes erecta TaxID=13708 RepID=A0AAD8NWP8_TARER|nr:hypothetical protein QVD17_19181 [Tagetes erecta]